MASNSAVFAESLDKVLSLMFGCRPGYVSIYQMSYMWYSAFAVFVTTVTGLLVSFLTGKLIIDVHRNCYYCRRMCQASDTSV